MLFLKNICLSFIFLLSNQAYPLNRCENLFAPTKTELSTSDKLTPEQFIDTQALGYIPIISDKIINRGENNFSFYAYHEINGQKEIIGGFHYGLEDNGGTLVIDLVRTEPEARKAHISVALFARLLAEHPKITKIKSILVDNNLQIISNNLTNGLNLEDSVKNTPAYKLRLRFGFSKITVLELHRSSYGYSGLSLEVMKP